MVEARTHAQLGAAGAALASAVTAVGVERWPRYLADANARAVAAASVGHAPGVVKASTAGTDVTDGIAIGGLILLYSYLRSREAGTSAAPSGPSVVHQAPPAEGNQEQGNAPAGGGAKPGEATLSDDRRKYILDGEGGGGHGPGRQTPKKSEFPSDWSDQKTADAIEDVANDPTSTRTSLDNGRTVVEGTREGVNIRVIIGSDGKNIVTAFPTNVSRNPE